MFRHVARNLRDNGVFVALVPYATDDPKGFLAETQRVRPKERGMINVTAVREVEEGVLTRIWAGTNLVVEFEAWHLRKEVLRKRVEKVGLGEGWNGGLVRLGSWRGRGICLRNGRLGRPSRMRIC